MHTPASRDFDDDSVTPEQIVDRAIEAGLDGIAVTDHNTGEWIDRVKEAGAAKGLAVFPGVEITCSGGEGGLHIIALFDVTCKREHVDGLLSALGLKPEQYGELTAIVDKSPTDVVKEIAAREALAVLAHANSAHGALKSMRGQQRISLIQSEHVHAAEGTDFRNDDKKQRRRRVVDLLDGTDPDFKRTLATYQASDNPSSTGTGHGLEGIGTRTAFFKLEKLSLDGLRQCFNDPAVRIRQDFEAVEEVYPHVRSMSVKGGFLDGSSVHFHEGLNSILGGKGVGKSLLIEFLRFALGQPPSVEEIHRDHQSKLAARLEDFGSVSVVLCDETGHEFSLTRTFLGSGADRVEPEEREDIARAFPVLFLSQNEIIRIAEDDREQLRFIDRFFDFRSFQRRIDQLEAQLVSVDADMADRLRAYEEERELKRQVKGVAEEIQRLDRKLKDPAFAKYRTHEEKDSALHAQRGYANKILAETKATREKALADPAPDLPAGVADDPLLLRIQRAAKQSAAGLVEVLDQALVSIEASIEKIEAEAQKWKAVFEDETKKYEASIKQAGGDARALAARRAERVREQQALNMRIGELTSKTAGIAERSTARLTLVKELEDQHKRYSNERRERCKRIESESGGRLEVVIHEATDRKDFEDRLKQLKRGSYLRGSEIEQLVGKLRPSEFMRAVVRFGLSRKPEQLKDIAAQCELSIERMVSLAEFLLNEYRYEDLLGLEYKAVPRDRPEIRFRVSEGRYEPLNRLSVGQKCTALLVVALTDGSMPIIIDQPEDSLDIRSVWEDICQKIRQGKERRQFVFTTHNSSLAVASDTDQFVVVEATADKGAIASNGAMDHHPISDEVITYLEGGKTTYSSKYKKYRGDKVVK